jgi:hypothetical protein
MDEPSKPPHSRFQRIPVADTRPRVDYALPSGEVVAIIFDHGDPYPFEVTYTLKGGEVVLARRVDVERYEFSGLVVAKQDGRLVLEMRAVRE